MARRTTQIAIESQLPPVPQNPPLTIADRGYAQSTGEIVLEGPAADLLRSED
jgi:hypothetical protein